MVADEVGTWIVMAEDGVEMKSEEIENDPLSETSYNDEIENVEVEEEEVEENVNEEEMTKEPDSIEHRFQKGGNEVVVKVVKDSVEVQSSVVDQYQKEIGDLQLQLLTYLKSF